MPLEVKVNQVLYEAPGVATLNRNGWQFSPECPLGAQKPNFFSTKYEDWQYEKEVRIILNSSMAHGNQKIKYKKESLNGVIFGLKCQKENAINILHILAENYEGYMPKLYKCRRLSGRYEIKYDEMTYSELIISYTE